MAAVKRKAIEDYLDIFAACGANPVFTLAALARSYVCPHVPAPYAVLDLGQRSSELAIFEDGLPTSVRVLPWGGQDLAQAPAKAATGVALAVRKVYITGANAWPPDVASRLAAALGNGAECEAVKLAQGEGRSAAVLGLRQAIERDRAWPSLVLETKTADGSARVVRPAPLRWAALAVALALAALAAPYAEALILKSRLAGKLAAMKQEKGKLGKVDRELEFLRYLKQGQPAYLEVLFIMAKAAPPGTRFDMLSMNRRGELSVRGSIKDSAAIGRLPLQAPRRRLLHQCRRRGTVPDPGPAEADVANERPMEFGRRPRGAGPRLGGQPSRQTKDDRQRSAVQPAPAAHCARLRSQAAQVQVKET